MTIQNWLIAAWGAVTIASIFLFFAHAFIARAEYRFARSKRARLSGERPFILAVALAGIAFAVVALGALRTLDGILGYSLGGYWPELSLAALGVLVAFKALFHWGVTFDRRAKQWWLFVLALVAWAGLMIWPGNGVGF